MADTLARKRNLPAVTRWLVTSLLVPAMAGSTRAAAFSAGGPWSLVIRSAGNLRPDADSLQPATFREQACRGGASCHAGGGPGSGRACAVSAPLLRKAVREPRSQQFR